MPVTVELLRSRRLPQVAALALMSFGIAGCSADMQTRLSQSQNSFSNPFNSDATGSVQPPAPIDHRREAPQYARPPASAYSSSALPPAVAAPQSYPSGGGSGGISSGGRGVSSYAPPAQPQLEATNAVTAPRSIAAARPAPSLASGPAPSPAPKTTIIVGTSDTLDIIARRYHVTPAEILAANGYKGPRALSPGQQLVIPRPGGPAVAAAAPAALPAAPMVAPKPIAVAAAPAASTIHFVNHGETLAGIARQNHVSVAELAHANNLTPTSPLKLGARLNVPGKSVAMAAPAAPAAALPQPVAALPAPAPTTKVASAAGPVQSARLAVASPTPEEKEEAPSKPAETTSALPTFRWPARGKVITSYGAKTNGKSNDGINIAVPEGTPVKAAEDGVVAYSGNELKGYGNLVLVRHSNGYVTAYAHASELMVKRGDPIKRGQVIAKSGQSGEVGSPQLHFEIRKGSSPVDPLQFLNGA
jgi:murein DD-endopeptidase MepM/ murein hydrolase activator NlpD